jgi:hypothetical protein
VVVAYDLSEQASTDGEKIRVALDWTLDLCFPKDFACVNPPTRRTLRSALDLREVQSGVQSANRSQAGRAVSYVPVQRGGLSVRAWKCSRREHFHFVDSAAAGAG